MKGLSCTQHREPTWSRSRLQRAGLVVAQVTACIVGGFMFGLVVAYAAGGSW